MRRHARLATVLALIAALLTAGLVLAPSAGADTLSAVASADTFVDSGAPNSSSGGTATKLTVQAGNRTKITYLKFDLSGIPAGATGISATVNVTTRSTTAGKTIRLHALNAGQTFTESTTWNTKPSHNATVLSSFCCTASGVRKSMAAGNVNGNGTWYFAMTVNTNSADLASREDSTAAARPELVVTYTPAEPTTTTAAPTTTTVAPTTTTVAPTTTTQPPPDPCPSGTPINDTQNIQSVLDANGPGLFCLADGRYRQGHIRVGAGDTIQGGPGAVLDGTKVVGNWVQDGAFWKSTGQTFTPSIKTYAPASRDDCQYSPAGYSIPSQYPTSENCHFVDLFKNDQRLQRVLSNTDLGPGKWNFDYDTDTIWLGEDPGTALFETSQFKVGMYGRDWTAKGFTLQKYAGGPSTGLTLCNPSDVPGAAIVGWAQNPDCSPSTVGAQFEGIVSKYNHDTGVHIVGNASRMVDSKILHNGKYGWGGIGATIEGTVDPRTSGSGPMEVGWNNELEFRSTGDWAGTWDAGGSKSVVGSGTIVRQIWAHDNIGPGIWFDICHKHTTIERNLVERNWMGISFELSWTSSAQCFGMTGPTQNSLIRHNKVRSNVEGEISVGSSTNVEVYGNVIDMYDGSRGQSVQNEAMSQTPHGVWLYLDDRQVEHDIFVHDNDITWHPLDPAIWPHKGHPVGYTGPTFDPATMSFTNNTYRVPTVNQGEALWQAGWGTFKTWSQWQALGLDAGSTLTTP